MDVRGLTSAEAAAELARVGPNEAVPAQRFEALGTVVRFFRNPLVLILLGAAGATAALGDVTNATIIVLLVSASFLLDFIQTRKSTGAVRRLQSDVAPLALVSRDGEWVRIPRRDVVPGDVARLSAGDLVPADGVLIEEKDLHVQEAALTGESMPSEKEIGTGDDQERVFLGSGVVSGVATMRITATGSATRFGDIARKLAERAPETEFERGLREFGALILRVLVLLVGFTLVTLIAFKHEPLESFLFVVALAVGLTPEFLPMITTITLARGAIHMARVKVIVKNLSSIQNFGSMDVLCSDKTGTLTSGHMTLDRCLAPDGVPSDAPRTWARLNSGLQSGVPTPLDLAILADGDWEVDWNKIDEVPFDFERRSVSVVAEKDGRRVLITKGAPESTAAKCYPPADLETAHSLGRDGYRVLAVAIRDIGIQERYGVEDEIGLTLVGYLAFIDPPLPDALETLHRLRAVGVEFKVITGDSEAVSRHVCSSIGLDPGEILLGDRIDQLGDDALQAVAERTRVFARVSPAQKNRIILALKARGHVVGYMGDGINDAPSLHAADVGISFAEATDVAKDAAQIILVERRLDLLIHGVREGRQAFGNVMKYLLMGTSSNFGNMLSMAGAALFLPFLPMLPTQILLNNLLYDLAQVSIPTDHVDEEYIKKPKHWDMRLIRAFMITIGPISSIFDFLTFWALLALFHAGPREFHTGWFVESLATQTLVLLVIRTRLSPWKSRPSAPLVWTIFAILAIAVALPFTPLASKLGFVPLPAGYFLFLTSTIVVYLLLVEWVKQRLFAGLFSTRGLKASNAA